MSNGSHHATARQQWPLFSERNSLYSSLSCSLRNDPLIRVLQAMSMRALVLLARVEDESELQDLRRPLLDELLSNRTIITCARPEVVPAYLHDKADVWQLSGIGLYLNEVQLLDREAASFLRRMCNRGAQSEYARVQRLHLGGTGIATSELRKDSMEALGEALAADTCVLTALDVSGTDVDGYALMQALRKSTTLTLLDMRMPPPFANEPFYETLGSLILEPSSSCSIGYLRCAAFEVQEGQHVLSLHERPLEPGALHLLAALLRHNRCLKELDLSATGVHKEGAAALAAGLAYNRSLTTLRARYNPAIDKAASAALRAAASSALVLELS